MKLAPGTPLAVSLWADEARPAEPAGRLAMAGGIAQLEWDTAIVASQLTLAPVLYPPEPGLHAARGRDFSGLHGFLADSLPEGWGALTMKRRLAKLGVRIEDLGALDRLALVGKGGRGALVFEPATTPPPEVQTLDLDALAAESAAILLGNDSDLADTLAALAGASGGARPKIHVGFDAGGGICVSEGEVAQGHEPWIVKFCATADPVDMGPVEFAYSIMARAAGIVMSESRLIASNTGPGYFATRRFDRPAPGQRVHMVSLAGAIEAPSDRPSASYDTFLRATRAITRHQADVEAAFRRMVFNVLACNRDDHTRQHSYLMSADGEWRLSPAYDLTFSHGPGGEHYLDIEGEGRNPGCEHVIALGAKHGFDARQVARIINEVRAAIADWPAIAAGAGVTTMIDEIGAVLADIGKRFG
ncbi:MAG: type II toxin-antitoxin system HipA family toxin [Sphingomonas bacterium]